MRAAPAKPKAFYEVSPATGGFAVLKNGETFKTPGENALVVPTRALAEVVVSEWRSQGEKPLLPQMFFTQLVFTALDVTGKKRAAILDQISSYAETELLCHRADGPRELVLRQNEIWQPVLDWCAEHFGAVLQTGTGIMPLTQIPVALAALRRALDLCDAFRLTGLRQAVDLSGSLVLGLALAERHLSGAQVFEAAELDASFQMIKWGDDPAIAKRRETLLRDLVICENWFKFIA